MVIFKWDHGLDTGIERLDRQHRQIMETCNTFFIRYKCCKGPDSIRDCMGFLEQYIMYHFQTEEAFQAECGYPGYRVHQALHKELGMKVKFFSVRLKSGPCTEKELAQFHQFLVEWLQNHLMEEDRVFAACYRAYLAAQNVK